MEFGFLAITILAFVIIIFGVLIFLASRYKRCPSNRILAIYGKVGEGKSVKCFHGGGAFVWPLIQDYCYMDLTPMTIAIPLKGALSIQNIRVNVPSTFTIAIEPNTDSTNNAAVRLLNLDPEEIEKMSSEILFGQLRLTIASLTIEQINQDREMFLNSIKNNIEPELKKIGLTLINVNITDITDESGYINSIGKKAAATAVNQAKVDVSQQNKQGDIGASQAEKERRVRVAGYNAEAVKGENEAQAHVAGYNATLAEKQAEANKRGEVANQNSIAEIQKATAVAATRRLEADEVVPKEIEKRKIEIDADAEAEKVRREAKGKADAIIAVKSAEATGIQKVLNAKAEGYNKLVSSCNNNTKDASTMLLVEKLEDIVELQVEAIKNIKIDKVTVWDNGSGEKGSSTANFLSNMVKSLPALHDVAEMAGLELPDYMGNTINNSVASNEDAQVDKIPEQKTKKS